MFKVLERVESEMDKQQLVDAQVESEMTDEDSSKGIGVGLLGTTGLVSPLGTPLLLPLGTPLLASHELKRRCKEVFGLNLQSKLDCIRSGTFPSKLALINSKTFF